MKKLEVSKVDYVLDAEQTRVHACHWPGCRRQVPPAMWGCRRHWEQLPKNIRDAIWRAFRPGQEKTGRVTEAYIQAARAAQNWIATIEEHVTKISVMGNCDPSQSVFTVTRAEITKDQCRVTAGALGVVTEKVRALRRTA